MHIILFLSSAKHRKQQMNLQKIVPDWGRVDKRGSFPRFSLINPKSFPTFYKSTWDSLCKVLFYFPFSFSSAVLVWFFHDISVIKAKWHIPRLAPQLVAFNFIQSKCPVEPLAVTATKAICHNRDKRNLYDRKRCSSCCFKVLKLFFFFFF